MFLFIEKITLIFFVLSICISLIPLINSHKSEINENAGRIIDFIITGTKLILGKFYIYLGVCVITFVVFSIVLNLYFSIPFIRVLLVIPSVITSCFAGWLSLKFSMSSIKGILSSSNNSSEKILNYCKSKSNFILTLLISLILFDISIWIIGLDKVLTLNLFGFSELLLSKLGYHWTSETLNNSDFLNLKNLFISTSLAGYAVGSTLHAVLARFNFSVFSVSFDTAADLIGYSKYDFPEDDLRNPSSIPDLIGDQLKNNYLVFSNLHSTCMISIVAISILGSFVGLVNHSLVSLNLVVFPILFTAYALFANSITTQIIKVLNVFKGNHFFKKYTHLICTNLFIVMGVYYLFLDGKINNNILISICFGIGASLSIYPVIYFFLSIKLPVIKYVTKNSKDSILSTISSGLCLGFLSAFLISVIICLILGCAFLISGDNVNEFQDFYNIACMALSILVSSFPIISNTLTKPLIDNAVGVSEMLSYDEQERKNLHSLNSFCNISICYFNVINSVVIILTGCVYLLFYIIKCLKVANIISYVKGAIDTSVLDTNSLSNSIEIKNYIMSFQIHFLNAKFILGVILGISFLMGFIALTMWGLSICYKKINRLTQEELAENPDVWSGTKCPNYFKLIQEVSIFSNRFMVVTFLILSSLIVVSWINIGVAGTIGFLIGQIVIGSILAIFFNISGTIWTNSKLLVELTPNTKGTPVHVAAIFSDKLGDIFKDSIAPVIIDKIKFIIFFAILMVALILKFDSVLQ